AEVPAKFPKSKHAAAAMYQQGDALYQADDRAGAVTVFQKAIADFPQSELLPDLYYALGTAQQELDQAKEAIATFEGFLQKFPKDPLANECRLRLARSLYKAQRYADAAKYFEQTAQLPDFPYADYALMHQAHCLYEQEQLIPAAGIYESLPKR